VDIVIDLETVPDQRASALDEILETLTVMVSSDLTKPKLMDALGVTDKYKTVGELKDMWLEEFGAVKKTEQAKEALHKTCFDGSKGEIASASFQTIDSDQKYSFVRGQGESESLLLENIWGKVNELCNSKPPFFIAHNADFDLPFLFHRSVIKRVKPNSYFKPHSRHGSDHYCTMKAWAGFKDRIGLDRLAKALGVEGKLKGMTGADVYQYWLDGRLAEIVTYCDQDVEVTKNIYKRINFL